MDNVAVFIDTHSALLANTLAATRTLMGDSSVQVLCQEYEDRKRQRHSDSLNAFTLVSSLYYRENFHSDVIKAFLDPTEKHHEGTKFLMQFINLLNDAFGSKVQIDASNYIVDAIVEREKGRIDVLILSPFSKHCIIVENKMNNAWDMERQLPRYTKKMMSEGYYVDALVYLPLEPGKLPDTLNWSTDDVNAVMPKLCILPAYSMDGTANLVDGWLLPCKELTKDINCQSILQQYIQLLISLTNNIMDSIIVNKFYQNLLVGDNLDTAISISNMLADIPTLMADRLVERFQFSNTYYQVWKYKTNFCGFIFYINGAECKIDIWTSVRGYDIYAFNQIQKEDGSCWVDNLECVKDLTKNHNGFEKKGISIKEEAQLIDWINKALAEIKPLCDK